MQSRISIWEVVYSSLLHPDRRGAPEPPSGRTSAVHHRIALFNSQYQIVQVVSQTDIMRYLHEHKDTIRDAMKTKLMDVPGAHSMALALSQFVCTSCRYHGEEH